MTLYNCTIKMGGREGGEGERESNIMYIYTYERRREKRETLIAITV